MDGGAWWAVVHGVTESWTQLSDSLSRHFHSVRYEVTSLCGLICIFLIISNAEQLFHVPVGQL